MYVPAAFKVDDPEKLALFMETYSFATLVTVLDGVPCANHLPILLRRVGGIHGTLVGHMARANDQWRHFEESKEALVIFEGPHGYISPAYYETAPAVPTWNYAAVHVYGVPRIIEAKAAMTCLLQESILKYEAEAQSGWNGLLPPEFLGKLMGAIVGFEIAIDRIEGKFKMNQNRPPGDIRKACEMLRDSGSQANDALAAMMETED